MNLCLALALILAPVLPGPTLVPRTTRPACSSQLNTHACDGDGRIIVSGSHLPKQSDVRPGVPVVVPEGAVRLIACGSGAAAELAVLGDLQASIDASNCANWTQLCRQSGPGPMGLSTATIRVVKQADGSWSLGGSVCQQPARPQVTAALVRQEVARLVPRAAIGIAPQKATLVNIQTIMWVGTAEQRALAPLAILGRRVVVTLRFDHVDWAFGDGQSDSPTAPGHAYDGVHAPCKTVDCPGYYGHTYVGTGAMAVTAQASWVASFTVDGGPALTIPGTVTGPVAAAALQVKQARGVLVPNPTGR